MRPASATTRSKRWTAQARSTAACPCVSSATSSSACPSALFELDKRADSHQCRRLEIRSLPPAALLVPSSPILRSVIVRDLDSPTCDDEANWLVSALFAEPEQLTLASGNGTLRRKIVRTRQPSAAADVMAGMDEEDEETSDSDSLRPSTSLSTPHAIPAGPPTLARFANLSHLALSHLSLVTLPRLPLPSVVSIDLSHNLLLELPANLVLLPNLVSLNLEGNMIQSLRGADLVLPAPSLASSAAVVRGTPSKRLRTATGLRVLNLDQNRIANLHGLAALSTLERLSIRDNRLAESQELHRLTVLPVLSDLYVCPQPFSALPAEEGWRVRLWEAFAREGRAELDCAKVDGEGVGWSERRKMRVAFPATSHAPGSSAADRPVPKPRSPDIVAVGARRTVSPSRSTRDKHAPQIDVSDSTPVIAQQSPQPLASAAGHAPSKTGLTLSPKPKRRKQRIVNLDGSVEVVRPGGPADGDDSDVSAVVERPARSPTKATTSSLTASSPTTLRVPTAHSSLKLPSTKSSHARRTLSSSVYSPAGPGSSSPPSSSAAESGDEFRRKLEGLRSDVGDSWLRVLSAGGAGNAGGSGSDSLSGGRDDQEAVEVPVSEESAPPSALEEPEVIPDAPEVVQVVKKPVKKRKGNGKRKG